VGFQKCYSNHSVFIRRTSSGNVIPAICIDDILLTGDDIADIEKAKQYLKTQFVTKNTCSLLGLKLLTVNIK